MLSWEKCMNLASQWAVEPEDVKYLAKELEKLEGVYDNTPTEEIEQARGYQNKVNHIRWSTSDSTGLIAVKVLDERVSLRRLAGNALPVSILLDVLFIALPDNWEEVAEKRHTSRKYDWCVSKRYGQSGCIDYILRYMRDVETLDTPTGGRIHVSMYGKLNEGFSLWLGDIPPLLAAILEDFPPESCNLYAYEPFPRGEYFPAGKNSGLQAALDRLGIKRI